MKIGNLNLSGIVLAAPLAGVSSRPFRVMALKGGAALTYTEMISSEGIVRQQTKTLEMMAFQTDERPIGIQIFGANPESMGKAAGVVAKSFAPDLIDLNFGCPVKKVVNKNGGAAVLKNLTLTEELIRAVIENSAGIPVTIKIRSGWDDASPVFVEVGRIAERCGVSAITLHARSRASGYSGLADWTAIKQLKEAVSIVVIGNGDIQRPEDARRMIDETGCDAVMVGRAALGNPFIFGEIDHYLRTGKPGPEPSMLDRIEMARRHAELMAEQFGETRGVIKMRRHFGWYVKGFPGASELRQRLVHIETLRDIDRIFAEYNLDLRLAGCAEDKAGQ